MVTDSAELSIDLLSDCLSALLVVDGQTGYVVNCLADRLVIDLVTG